MTLPSKFFQKKKGKKTDRQKLINKLDTVFSEFIRLRDSDHNGICKCITCGERQHWIVIQCGHYVRRSNMATRWQIKNANPQCTTCNCVMDGREEEHGKAIDEKYGAGTADQLEKLGRTEVHFSEPELESMCQELRAEIKALKTEKFG